VADAVSAGLPLFGEKLADNFLDRRFLDADVGHFAGVSKARQVSLTWARGTLSRTVCAVLFERFAERRKIARRRLGERQVEESCALRNGR
jgi:hypothetical protein